MCTLLIWGQRKVSQVGLELPILLPHLKCWGYEFHVKSRQLAVQLYTSSNTAQSQLNSGGAAQGKKADKAGRRRPQSQKPWFPVIIVGSHLTLNWDTRNPNRFLAYKAKLWLGMVVHTDSPSTWQGDLRSRQANLGYRAKPSLKNNNKAEQLSFKGGVWVSSGHLPSMWQPLGSSNVS